jgi:sulfide dehydrogenase cytochrome subunit
MQKQFLHGIPIFLLVLVQAATAGAADQLTARGVALINACAACHGSNGHSQGAIPSIDTLSREKMVTALRSFRAGERQGTVMNRIAKGLSDDDIDAIATQVVAAQSH